MSCVRASLVPFLLLSTLAWPSGSVAAQPALLQELLNPGPNTLGFGASMAVDGETLVVGAPELASQGIQRGAVYIFVKAGDSWVLQHTLALGTGVGFGDSVAMSGDTLIVSISSLNGFNLGPLVFVRSNGAWTQQAELVASGATRLGETVRIDGNTALIATRGHGVYAFVRSGSVWTQQATLLPERDFPGFNFSVQIELDGETAKRWAPMPGRAAQRPM